MFCPPRATTSSAANLVAATLGSAALALTLSLAGPAGAATHAEMPIARNGDPEDAIRQFNIRAETGDPDAQVFFAELYRLGADVDLNPEKAFGWYLRAARQGHTRAQSSVGSAFLYGIGVLQDYEKAGAWCLKAARNGDAAAVHNLGRIHAEGLGVTPDPSRAYMWFTIGARMGDEKSREMGSTVRSRLTTLEIQRALDMVNNQLAEFQDQ